MSEASGLPLGHVQRSEQRGWQRGVVDGGHGCRWSVMRGRARSRTSRWCDWYRVGVVWASERPQMLGSGRNGSDGWIGAWGCIWRRKWTGRDTLTTVQGDGVF